MKEEAASGDGRKILGGIICGASVIDDDGDGEVEEVGALHGPVEVVKEDERDALVGVVAACRGEPDGVVVTAAEIRVVEELLV